MASIFDFKNNAQKELERLQASFNKTRSFVRDERYWRPKLDQAGSGSAIIRFLPAPEGEEDCAVPRITYNFKGPTGRWYIEPSPASIGLPDPAAELWREWSAGTDADKQRAKIIQRRIGYISNIYIVKHPANPEDEGKTFLFEYGTKIHKKLEVLMLPDEKLGEEPRNPFHPWEGSNFRLKVMKVDNFPNYDESRFEDRVGPFASDEEMERAWKACYSLKGELSPNKFKPYEELKTKLHEVLGLSGSGVRPVARSAPPVQETAPAETKPDLPWEDNASDEEDEVEFLQNLTRRRSAG